MPDEYIPKRGHLVVHEPTSELLVVLGKIGEGGEYVCCLTLPEKKIRVLPIREGDFTQVFSGEELANLDSILPKQVDLS